MAKLNCRVLMFDSIPPFAELRKYAVYIMPRSRPLTRMDVSDDCIDTMVFPSPWMMTCVKSTSVGLVHDRTP